MGLLCWAEFGNCPTVMTLVFKKKDCFLYEVEISGQCVLRATLVIIGDLVLLVLAMGVGRLGNECTRHY